MGGRLHHNVFALLSLQGLRYLIPLLILPYLLRTLGPMQFGWLAFAQAYAHYLVAATDYGFNLSATRRVALLREDPEQLGRFAGTVFAAKALLLAVGFAASALALLFVPTLLRHWELVLACDVLALGSLLLPVWLLQGLERMRLLMVVSTVARLVTMALVFILVRDQADLVTAALLLAGGDVLAGMIILAGLGRWVNVRPIWPGWPAVQATLREGWPIFLSNMALTLYVSSNTFVLGLVASPMVIGYFAAGEKLVRAAQGLLSPLSQAVFPFGARLAQDAPGQAWRFFRRLLLGQGGIALVLSCALWALAPVLVDGLFGARFLPSVAPTRWLAFVPFVVALSNVLGVHIMLNFGLDRLFSRILIGAGLLNLTMMASLAHKFGSSGAAMSVLLAEIGVTSMMAMVLAREGLLQNLLRGATL